MSTSPGKGAHAGLVSYLVRQGIMGRTSFAAAAMQKVDRAGYCPFGDPYEDAPQPIGHGQTISQPYIVARMTEALRAGAAVRSVLEIGTGCGYQTAVLAGLVPQVFTIERIEPLLQRAKSNLREIGIANVRFRHGDGFEGWRAMGPYDSILVAAAPAAVPEELLAQLAPGGRLVMPIGPDGRQRLLRYTRRGTVYDPEDLGAVSFVPMLAGVVGSLG